MSASKNDLDPKRLFQNLSAWFSGSVAARRRTLWGESELFSTKYKT